MRICSGISVILATLLARSLAGQAIEFAPSTIPGFQIFAAQGHDDLFAAIVPDSNGRDAISPVLPLSVYVQNNSTLSAVKFVVRWDWVNAGGKGVADTIARDFTQSPFGPQGVHIDHAGWWVHAGHRDGQHVEPVGRRIWEPNADLRYDRAFPNYPRVVRRGRLRQWRVPRARPLRIVRSEHHRSRVPRELPLGLEGTGRAARPKRASQAYGSHPSEAFWTESSGIVFEAYFTGTPFAGHLDYEGARRI